MSIAKMLVSSENKDPITPRKPRTPSETHKAIQVTQKINYEIIDEPWVWAPIRPRGHPAKRKFLKPYTLAKVL